MQQGENQTSERKKKKKINVSLPTLVVSKRKIKIQHKNVTSL